LFIIVGVKPVDKFWKNPAGFTGKKGER